MKNALEPAALSQLPRPLDESRFGRAAAPVLPGTWLSMSSVAAFVAVLAALLATAELRSGFRLAPLPMRAWLAAAVALTTAYALRRRASSQAWPRLLVALTAGTALLQTGLASHFFAPHSFDHALEPFGLRLQPTLDAAETAGVVATLILLLRLAPMPARSRMLGRSTPLAVAVLAFVLAPTSLALGLAAVRQREALADKNRDEQWSRWTQDVSRLREALGSDATTLDTLQQWIELVPTAERMGDALERPGGRALGAPEIALAAALAAELESLREAVEVTVRDGPKFPVYKQPLVEPTDGAALWTLDPDFEKYALLLGLLHVRLSRLALQFESSGVSTPETESLRSNWQSYGKSLEQSFASSWLAARVAGSPAYSPAGDSLAAREPGRDLPIPELLRSEMVRRSGGKGRARAIPATDYGRLLALGFGDARKLTGPCFLRHSESSRELYWLECTTYRAAASGLGLEPRAQLRVVYESSTAPPKAATLPVRIETIFTLPVDGTPDAQRAPLTYTFRELCRAVLDPQRSTLPEACSGDAFEPFERVESDRTRIRVQLDDPSQDLGFGQPAFRITAQRVQP